jgi:hypothetical protein
MHRLFLAACLTLAACGADGDPEPPTRAASGEIAVGVVVK